MKMPIPFYKDAGDKTVLVNLTNPKMPGSNPLYLKIMPNFITSSGNIFYCTRDLL